MIVFSPSLLMIDTTVPQIIWVVFTAITGMVAIGSGVIGYWYRKLYWFERIVGIATGLLLIYPEKFSDWVGLGIFVIMFVIQVLSNKKGSDNDHTNGKTGVTIS